MKRNLLFLLMAFMTLSFGACNDDTKENDDNQNGNGTITIEWATNADFDTLEITSDMAGKAVIEIKAEAGIKSLQLNINSPVLTDEILALAGLSTSVDLATVELTAEQAAIVSGLPYGDAVLNQTEVTFDVSNLVPMILLYQEQAIGNHVFSIIVTDNNGKSESCDLVFRYSGADAPIQTGEVEFTDVNLWTNSAKATLENATESMVLQYRREGSTAWQEATWQDGAFLLETTWTSTTNDEGLNINVPNTETGVWAGVTYEYQVMDGTTKVTDGVFRPEAGDIIPNGDMSGWSLKGTLPYPNAEGDSIWDSGNNTLTFGLTLCQEDTVTKGVACLSSGLVLGSVFTPGNMFTGDFIMSGFTGTAYFGKPYTWTARPKALKVRVKAEVGKITHTGTNDPEGENLKDKQDKAVVFAAVVDWTAQHGVTSGLAKPTGVWHPTQYDKLDEGAILGYASHYIEGNTNDYEEIEIPFEWYNNTAMPSNDYTLVISCAASYRGDYLTGCSTNKMWIDSFEWVY